MSERPQVVIVGGGFAGLWALRTLAGSKADVLLVDRNNYHTFLPLLYQIAAAELEPEEIAYPVRSILRGLPNVRFYMAGLQSIELASRLVRTSERDIPYDYLILATGSVSHFFDVPGAAEHGFQLKTLEQGIALRNHILCSFERAVNEPDADRRRRALTFTVVGGGSMGVEFAGALAELINRPLLLDYPTLDFREVRVLLLEAVDRLLPDLAEPCSRYSYTRLARMGVDIRLNSTVAEVTKDSVRLKDGTDIPTETVVWTAGVRGDPVLAESGLPQARAGRVAVLPTLQVSEHPEVYAVGDLAYFEQDGRALPMTAPVAIQEGAGAARNIIRQIDGRTPLPFRYKDKGTMVTIGRRSAVAQLAGRCFTGFGAWMLWLGVHILNLIGFRNRLFVMINWARDYFFFERAVRLILPPGTDG